MFTIIVHAVKSQVFFMNSSSYLNLSALNLWNTNTNWWQPTSKYNPDELTRVLNDSVKTLPRSPRDKSSCLQYTIKNWLISNNSSQ